MVKYLFYENQPFPPHEEADEEGLLAIGGNLTLKRLFDAYTYGVFPWYNEEPVLWWSPNPRFVLHPEKIKISKSMKKILKSNHFKIRADLNFKKVIQQCSMPRKDQDGTWINKNLIEAYFSLHKEGFAHSIEVYLNDELVGGLYGVSIGKMFFGESMFSKVDNSSKSALISLCHILKMNKFDLIDAQVHTPHLESMGAEFISRKEFLNFLENNIKKENLKGNWNHIFENFKTSEIFD